MANEKVFKYKIVTQVDGDPLKALEKTLKSITASVSTLSNSFVQLGPKISTSMKGANNSVESLIGTIKKLGATMGAIGAIKFVAGGVWDFGKKVIESAKFKQSALSSLSNFYGDNKAKDIFKNSLGIANAGPADTRPLLERTFRLASSGFSAHQLGKLQTLLSDIEGGGGNEAVLDGAVQAFNAIAGGGRPELGSAFITDFVGKTNFLRYQAKTAGLKDWQNGNLDSLNKQTMDLQRSGRFSPTSSQQGLEEAINAKLKQSKIGDTSDRMSSSSLGGALSNLSSAFDTLFLSIDFDKIKGIDKFREIINEISTTLTSDEFKGALGEVISSLFGPLENFKKGDAKKFLLGLLEKAQRLWDILGKAWEFMKRLLFTDTSGALTDVFKASADAFRYLGMLIGEGIKAAFFGGDTKEPERKLEPPGATEDNSGIKADLPLSQLDAQVREQAKGGFQLPDLTGVTINQNIEVNGNADPKEVAEKTGSATAVAVKSTQKSNLRKAGRSN